MLDIIYVDTGRRQLPTDFIATILSLESNSAQTYRHPTMTEPEIVDFVLENYTKPGESIIDPMCGVGTIVKCAIEKGRDGIGMDIVPEYVKLANKWIENETGQSDKIILGSAFEMRNFPIVRSRIPIRLCFFSPPLLRVNRGSYPENSDQIGNFGPEKVKLWLKGMGKLMREAKEILAPDGLLIINWRNQKNGENIIPLAYLGINQALNLGFNLIGEKLVVFHEQNRAVEFLHVFIKTQ